MTDVSRETADKLRALETIVVAENARQNLIAKSTVDGFQQRHVADSLQLLDLAQPGIWLDVGTGGGFPGMVVAIARRDPIIMVEPRARRAAFLQSVIDALELSNATILQSRVEASPPADAAVISARAVAPLSVLFDMTRRHAAPDCLWLLPKGRGAAAELATARQSWHGDFRLVPSRTDPEASIVMARNVSPRSQRRSTS